MAVSPTSSIILVLDAFVTAHVLLSDRRGILQAYALEVLLNYRLLKSALMRYAYAVIGIELALQYALTLWLAAHLLARAIHAGTPRFRLYSERAAAVKWEVLNIETRGQRCMRS